MRSRFCEHVSVAEELVPLRVLRNFYNKHCPQAALPLQYPGSTLLKDELPQSLVEAS